MFLRLPWLGRLGSTCGFYSSKVVFLFLKVVFNLKNRKCPALEASRQPFIKRRAYSQCDLMVAVGVTSVQERGHAVLQGVQGGLQREKLVPAEKIISRSNP